MDLPTITEITQGREIQEIAITDNVLVIKCKDLPKISILDDGQSCCEKRYMTADDDLSSLVGQRMVSVILKDHIKGDGEWGPHEIQFLEVQTDQGFATIVNHNEHNGYYGGFWLRASIASKKEPNQ